MIKTKMAFLAGRSLFSQSEQFKKYSKSSDWLEKSWLSKKTLSFWLCKQANICQSPDCLPFRGLSPHQWRI